VTLFHMMLARLTRLTGLTGLTHRARRMHRPGRQAVAIPALACAALLAHAALAGASDSQIDTQLEATLRRNGVTGKIESALPQRLGRPLDPKMVDLGRRLFFDTAGGLRQDNACAGCHSPSTGMADTQSIAIGVQNNGLVGPGRKGPRNQRRSPSVLNTAFYPSLMWEGRFFAPSKDPFDNSLGYIFPMPEGGKTFPPHDTRVKHLLVAQAHLPPTELKEMAGFQGTRGTLGSRFDVFDDGIGIPLPPPDATGSRNEPIRQVLLGGINAVPPLVALFGSVFPEVAAGAPIDASIFGRALAEFQFSLTRANAPIDQYARGDRAALSLSEKRGALLFFGKANCVACHATAGESNEMFSDFKPHNIAVPQIAPRFGKGTGNVVFDGPGENEDFGLEKITRQAADRYKFRTAPLRNVALQPAFFHNGAFTRLDDAIRHHLNVGWSARLYFYPAWYGVAADLSGPVGPVEPMMQSLDPLLGRPIALTPQEMQDLVRFVGNGLLDPRARPSELCKLVPPTLLSGNKPMVFEGCASP
jgi:cytochrome c peroxidase